MTVLGTIRLVNITQYAMEHYVTFTMPLARGRLYPIAGYSNVKAVDLSAASPDRRVQWYPMGELWDDGSCKMVRCHVLATMPAGSTGSNPGGHTHYSTKQLQIEIDTSITSGNFTFHSEVAANFSRSIWAVTFPHGATSPGDPNPHSGGTVGLQPWDIRQNGTSVEEDIEQDVNGQARGDTMVRTFRCRARTYPTKLPGASYWTELIIEIGSNSRYIRYWWLRGNGMASPPDNERQAVLGNPHWWMEKDGKCWLTMLRPEQNSPNMIVDYKDIYVPNVVDTDDTSVTGFWIHNITAFDSSDWNRGTGSPGEDNRRRWGAETGGVVTGWIAFTDGAVGVEASTYQGLQEARIMAVSEDWASHECFGPFGLVPPNPGNSLVFDATSAYNQAAKQCKANFDAHISWYNYPFAPPTPDPRKRQIHDFSPRSGTSGFNDSFGNHKLWHVALSGWPDMRGYEVDTLLEMNRPLLWKNQDVSWVRPEERNKKVPSKWTNLTIFNGDPFTANQTNHPPEPSWADAMGRTRAPETSPGYENNSQGASFNWETRGDQHMQWTCIFAYYQLSGDRFAKELIDNPIRLILLSTVHRDDTSTYRIGAGRVGGPARAHGRWTRNLTYYYRVTGDEEALNVFEGWWHTHKYNGSLGNWRSFGWLDSQFSYWSRGDLNYGEFSNTDAEGNAWNINGQHGCQGNLKPCGPVIWQEGIHLSGLYALMKLLRDKRPSTGDEVAAVVWQIAKSALAHATRKNTGSGGRLQFGAAFADPYLATKITRGTPLPDALKFDTNWSTAKYALWGGYTPQIETIAVIGWEMAQENSDAVIAALAKEIIDQIFTDSGSVSRRQGPYGFDRFGQYTEWAGIVKNPWTTRSSSDLLLALKPPGFVGTSDMELIELGFIGETFNSTSNILDPNGRRPALDIDEPLPAPTDQLVFLKDGEMAHDGDILDSDLINPPSLVVEVGGIKDLFLSIKGSISSTSDMDPPPTLTLYETDVSLQVDDLVGTSDLVVFLTVANSVPFNLDIGVGAEFVDTTSFTVQL